MDTIEQIKKEYDHYMCNPYICVDETVAWKNEKAPLAVLTLLKELEAIKSDNSAIKTFINNIENERENIPNGVYSTWAAHATNYYHELIKIIKELIGETHEK